MTDKPVVFREIELKPESWTTFDRNAFLVHFDVCDEHARVEGVEQVGGRGAPWAVDTGNLLVRDRGVLVFDEEGNLPECFPRAVACLRVTSRRLQLPEGCGKYLGTFSADGSRWRVFEYGGPKPERRANGKPSASKASPPPAETASHSAPAGPSRPQQPSPPATSSRSSAGSATAPQTSPRRRVEPERGPG